MGTPWEPPLAPPGSSWPPWPLLAPPGPSWLLLETNFLSGDLTSVKLVGGWVGPQRLNLTLPWLLLHQGARGPGGGPGLRMAGAGGQG